MVEKHVHTGFALFEARYCHQIVDLSPKQLRKSKLVVS
jgi:hypothetical protein